MESDQLSVDVAAAAAAAAAVVVVVRVMTTWMRVAVAKVGLPCIQQRILSHYGALQMMLVFSMKIHWICSSLAKEE